MDDIYQISLLSIIACVAHNASKISTQKQAQTETEAEKQTALMIIILHKFWACALYVK